MAQNIRYGKPCMTNLPPELGRQIIDEIMNSPKPDRREMHEKNLKAIDELKKKMESKKND
ncbi:MAG: hypothetical protein IJ555_08805 [Ruminococcus sp.]|nr:hypothetical protein [Ruminococcus sp.]